MSLKAVVQRFLLTVGVGLALLASGLSFSAVGTVKGAVPGEGFHTFDIGQNQANLSSYTIRLVDNGKNVESLRGALEAAAADVASAGGTQITVAPGTIPYTLNPGFGEIIAFLSDASPCGANYSCGEPIRTVPRMHGAKKFITGSWLFINTKAVTGGVPVALVKHELGHALGLAHYSDLYGGQYQLMHPSIYPTGDYRSGDRNGLAWLNSFLSPEVETNPATAVQETQATFNGRVAPSSLPTTYRFEYGTTTAYGNSVPNPAASAGSGVSPVAASFTATGLQLGTTYHYRIVATNAMGTSYGQDRTFKTLEDEKFSNSWAAYNESSGETSLYDRNSAGAMAYSQWQPGKGWVSGVLGGSVAAGTNPAVVYSPATGETSLYYQSTTGALAYLQWTPGSGWGSGVISGPTLAPGSSPAVVYSRITGETSLYYRNSAGAMAYSQWQPGKGWVSGTIY